MSDWEPDPSAAFARRVGAPKIPCDDNKECPDIWELTNGDVAVIGRDLTREYSTRLPVGVNVGKGERLIVIPGRLMPVMPEVPLEG